MRRGQTERLPQMLETIEERTRHLESFILGYARFANAVDAARRNVRLGRFPGAAGVLRIEVPDRGLGLALVREIAEAAG